MEKFDVVIVGAGPAGLNCAQTLAKSQKKVILLEKNDIIGPKVCAGGLTNHDINYINLPRRILDYKYDAITLHTPFNKDVIKSDKNFIYTVERKTLGQWQLRKLKKTNVQIRKKVKVTEIGKDYVVINNSKKIKFKYLVGADGAASIVRKHLGIPVENIGVAVQYIVPTKKYKKIEFFFDSKLFHSWYAWIFPHKDYVSIGCGSDPRFLSSKKLLANFSKWLKQKRIDISKAEYQAHPINFDYQGYKFKNIFLAGDAAGLASGFTGEGIYPALVSGSEIGKMILDKGHVPKQIGHLIKTKDMHNKILHFFERSGPLRKIEYELLALLLRVKLLDKEFIKVFA